MSKLLPSETPRILQASGKTRHSDDGSRADSTQSGSRSMRWEGRVHQRILPMHMVQIDPLTQRRSTAELSRMHTRGIAWPTPSLGSRFVLRGRHGGTDMCLFCLSASSGRRRRNHGSEELSYAGCETSTQGEGRAPFVKSIASLMDAHSTRYIQSNLHP